MTLKNVRRVLLTGLALGMAAGTVEAAVILAGLRSPGDLGNLLLVDAAVWGAVGLAVSFLVSLASGTREQDEKRQRAILSLRTVILLAIIALGIHVNARFLPAVFHWSSLVFNGFLLILAATGWVFSGRAVSFSGARTFFSSLSRAWAVLIIASVATGVIAQHVVGSSRTLVLSRFSPENPTPVRHEPHAPRVMLLGLDSATWRIVSPLVESGRMPNLEGLMRQGTWGVLRSYETSHSPVVWTSIMTGKAPEDHGITDWSVATATNRRAKPLWEIAEEHGCRSAVVNVSGTFPVLGDRCDAILAGLPLPTGTLSNSGWLFTTRPGQSGEVLPTERLPLDPASLVPGKEWRAEVPLMDLPVSLPSGRTAPVMLLSRLNPRWMDRVQRNLVPVCFGRMDIVLANDASLGEVTLRGSGDGPLFRLRKGERSDWLVAEVNGRKHSFKVHFLATGPQEISFCVTPLYPFPDDALARPADWVTERMVTPYVPEGVGWTIFQEPRLLRFLWEHLTDVEEGRVNMGLAILEDRTPDLFVFIVTLTDRIQHSMLKFLMPADYEKLAGELGGAYEKYKPTAAQIEEFGPVIPDTYARADEWLGRFLAYADASTTVVVVSDHGASPGRHDFWPTGGLHHPDGVYVIARLGAEPSGGPLSSTLGPELILEDITPTVLGVLGIPPARDMRGTLADFALPSGGRDMDPVDTYESAKDRRDRKDVLGRSVEEQLRSLGYIK